MTSKSGSSMQSSSRTETRASISDSPELENYHGYHGYMPREEVNRLLRNPGDFIVRQTELQAGEGFQLVLSVRVSDKACHFPISMNAQGRFYVNKQREFNTAMDLVLHYWQTGEMINENTRAICRTHVPRQEWELHRDQIHVGELLGHGEFGAVHRGTLILPDKEIPIAVKLHKVKSLEKEAIKDFLNEARLLRTFQNENIVQFYGVSIDKEPIMLCMELANGGSLDKYLRKNSAILTEAGRLRMCVEAARGLKYLHEKGCIHRDVSARNCLVSDGHIKISDFGLAQQLNRPPKTADASNLNKLPVRWLAPEAFQGKTTTQSDVYSFGVLMWEIFSNAEMPYKDMTLLQVFEQVHRKTLKLDRIVHMPDKVHDIMNKCLEHNPQDRYDMKTVAKKLKKQLPNDDQKRARSYRDDKSKKAKGNKIAKEDRKRKKPKDSKKSASKSPKSHH